MKQKNRRIAAAFNFAPHYRQEIYQKMAEELAIDFYFGDKLQTTIRRLDTQSLSRFKGWLKNRWCKGFYWQQGLLRHFHSYSTFLMTGEIKNLTSWAVLVLSKLFGKRVIWWTHGWYASGSSLNQKVQRLYFKSADVLLTYSEYGRSKLIEQGIPAHKIACIYNSLAYEQQLQLRKQLVANSIFSAHFGNEHPVLLFIGRLEANKKIEQLLKVTQMLKERSFLVNVVLIGTGPMEAKLNNQTQKWGLTEQVWFYGPTYEETEISTLLYNADLCVSPGNVGLTAMHALMYGLPVASHNELSSQMPEVEAILPGKTGFLFEPNKLVELAQKVEDWLKKFGGSSKKREEVRQHCFDLIDEKYNPNVQVEVLRKVLDK